MKRNTILAIILIVLGVFIAGISLLICFDNCEKVTYQLTKQYIGNIDSNATVGLAPCDNCLIMEVQETYWAPTGLKTVITENHTLFFANEDTLYDDLEAGDYIKVRWCNVKGHNVIRGVERQTDLYHEYQERGER